MIRGHSQEDIPYFDALNRRIIPLDETGRAYNIIININGNGNNVLFESHDTVVNQSLPATVTEEQYNQILEMLEKFLESEQAETLTVKELRTAQTELTEARKEGREKGWERILSIAANIATIGSAIFPFFI